MRLTLLLAGLAACSEYDLSPEDETDDAPLPGEPVADAGPDQVVIPLTDIRLDGSASYDPDDRAITAYQWTVVDIPPGSTAHLSDPGDDEPTFFADIAGTYTFDLTVQNDLENWDSSPDRVVVNAEPSAGFYVQLTWDAEVDLDLHLLDGTGSLFELPGDTCYCNPEPEWGAVGPGDNPSLDWDEIDGFGPETTTIAAPTSGTFAVKVHYYGQFGGDYCEDIPCPTTTATLRLFVDGVEKEVVTTTLNNQGQVWNVGTVRWPGAEFSNDGQITSTIETTCF